MNRGYEDLTRSFESRDLDGRAFRHRDHVGVAYQMLKSYDFVEASTRYAESIKSIATLAGAPGKFNTTITFAFLSLIAERMRTTRHADFDDFIEQNPNLLAKDVLERWYSTERLGSDLARSVFLMPDRPS